MKKEVDPFILKDVYNMKRLVNPEYIFFFDGDPTKYQGECSGDASLSALVIGINHRLSNKEKIMTVIHELVETTPKFRWSGGRIRSRPRDERKIDGITKRIYFNHEDLRIYLEEQIDQADPRVLNGIEKLAFKLKSLGKLYKQSVELRQGL